MSGGEHKALEQELSERQATIMKKGLCQFVALNNKQISCRLSGARDLYGD